MNAPICLRARALTLLLAAPSLLALIGCGGAPTLAEIHASKQSVSAYEAAISRNKAATPGKVAGSKDKATTYRSAAR